MDKLNKAQRQIKSENNQFQRQLKRGQQNLDNQEKKLIIEIKAAAKRNDKSSCNILAKQLNAIRAQKQRNIGLGSHMSATQMKADSLASMAKYGGVMQTMTQCTEKINKTMDKMNLPKQLGNFEKEYTKIEMTEELMDDCLSSIWDDVDDNVVDDQVAKVLDELAIDIGQSMPSVPSGSLPSSSSTLADRSFLQLGAKSKNTGDFAK